MLQSLTCEILQTQLPQAKVSVTSVVKKDCERVTVFVQFGPSDDPQVLQGQVVKLVQGHQHIPSHFSDRLRRQRWRRPLECVLKHVNNMEKKSFVCDKTTVVGCFPKSKVKRVFIKLGEFL